MVNNYFKINHSAIRLSIKDLRLECYESLVLVMVTDINLRNGINDTKYYPRLVSIFSMDKVFSIHDNSVHRQFCLLILANTLCHYPILTIDIGNHDKCPTLCIKS